jgi:hypothetical protein
LKLKSSKKIIHQGVWGKNEIAAEGHFRWSPNHSSNEMLQHIKIINKSLQINEFCDVNRVISSLFLSSLIIFALCFLIALSGY